MNELYPQVRLIDICDQERGIRYGILKVGNFATDGIPVIRGGDIKSGKVCYDNNKKVAQEISDQFKRTILHGGEIVINLIGEAGHSAVVPKEYKGFNVTRDVAVIPLEDSVETRFIDFYLRSAGVIEWMRQRLQGSVTQKINLETLRDVPVYLPPIYEQKAIAHILGTLDDKIELNRKTNETLEAMAKALFKSWFVDFDPVRAKAEGRPTGLPAEISDLFPDSFEDSELGEIPSGWEISLLGDHIDLIKGRSYKSDELNPSTTALVTLKSFHRNGGYRPDGLKGFTGEYKEQQVVKPGELVIALTDVTQAAEVIGRPAIVKSDSHCSTLVASLDVGIVRPKATGRLSTPYLYFLMLAPRYIQHILGYTSGTTVLHLAKNGASNFPLPIGSLPLLNHFAQLADSILRQVDASARQSELLAKTRDALLPKLISGEIRIPDAEKMLEEVGI
jgi:type I restriction enzyme S subunit